MREQRPIKFRAWHQAGLSKPEDNRYAMTYWKLGQGLDNSWFYTHAKAVMQYTGLKDKNGVEIYEGDVIHMKEGSYSPIVKKDGQTGSKNLVVEWSKGLTGFYPFNDYDSDCQAYPNLGTALVVGNIYENPNLLGDTTNE
jgi:uncharacterized phage protein (TIGR01671 family)